MGFFVLKLPARHGTADEEERKLDNNVEWEDCFIENDRVNNTWNVFLRQTYAGVYPYTLTHLQNK